MKYQLSQKQLEKLRDVRGNISQEQIGKLLGISQVAYNNIESGKRKIKDSELETFLDIFELPKEELFQDIQEHQKLANNELLACYTLLRCHRLVNIRDLQKVLYKAELNGNFGMEFIKLPRGVRCPLVYDLVKKRYIDNGKYATLLIYGDLPNISFRESLIIEDALKLLDLNYMEQIEWINKTQPFMQAKLGEKLIF